MASVAVIRRLQDFAGAAAAGSFGCRFGRSVALSADGTTALVGAFNADSQWGTAYIFHVSSASAWSGGTTPTAPTAKLTNGSSTQDRFGASVALSSDGATALVGAFNVDSGSGAAYIFQSVTTVHPGGQVVYTLR